MSTPISLNAHTDKNVLYSYLQLEQPSNKVQTENPRLCCHIDIKCSMTCKLLDICSGDKFFHPGQSLLLQQIYSFKDYNSLWKCTQNSIWFALEEPLCQVSDRLKSSLGILDLYHLTVCIAGNSIVVSLFVTLFIFLQITPQNVANFTKCQYEQNRTLQILNFGTTQG